MSIERAKKQQAQQELRDADKKMTALLNKSNMQIMANAGAFREDVGAAFRAMIRAVWALTEVPDRAQDV